jgi:CheY-like chemotaxis protein
MKKVLITDTLVKFQEGDLSPLPFSDVWVNVASSAEEMLDIHRHEKVDLIILELDTPKMGGDVFCSTLRSDTTLKDVSIVLVSPNWEDALERCFSCGANYVITQPIAQQEFITKINELIQIPQRENFRVLMNIAINRASGGNFYSTSQNISTKGILLETNQILKEGDSLTISFLLRLNHIKVKSTVVRAEQRSMNLYQYGIKFVDLDPYSEELIENFVNIRKNL